MKRSAPEDFEDEPPLYAGVPVISDPSIPSYMGLIAIDASALPPYRKSRDTYRDAVAAYLQARPNQWVSGLELAKIGGAYAWRTRVSDCRTQLGMTIENRQRHENGAVISEYRAPPIAPTEPS